MIRAVLCLFTCMSASSVLLMTEASARTQKSKFVRAPGAQRLGPWVEEGWQREDWSRAPQVRGWGYSAPSDYDPITGYPSISAEYPWGYTTPYVRVGHRCIANEINQGLGGMEVRYQRVLPSYYCR